MWKYIVKFCILDVYIQKCVSLFEKCHISIYFALLFRAIVSFGYRRRPVQSRHFSEMAPFCSLINIWIFFSFTCMHPFYLFMYLHIYQLALLRKASFIVINKLLLLMSNHENGNEMLFNSIWNGILRDNRNRIRRGK